MSALPPEQVVQLLSQQGSVSTTTQLCPLGQPALGSQSVASKHPSVNVIGWTQPGTSQRQPLIASHAGDVVTAEQGSGGGHGGISIDHVPLGEHCALGPHWPIAAYEHDSVQQASQAEPAVGIVAGHTHAGGKTASQTPPEQVTDGAHGSPGG
jgi:hypothetical protein